MADGGSKEGSTWPMPKFRFEVDLGTELKSVAFQEVSGMEAEVQVIVINRVNKQGQSKYTVLYIYSDPIYYG